jgi:hypothetical protein
MAWGVKGTLARPAAGHEIVGLLYGFKPILRHPPANILPAPEKS